MKIGVEEEEEFVVFTAEEEEEEGEEGGDDEGEGERSIEGLGKEEKDIL